MKTRDEAVKELNELTQKGEPYFFIADFEGQNFLVLSGPEVHAGSELFFDFGGVSNYQPMLLGTDVGSSVRIISAVPPVFEEYAAAFRQAKKHIAYGNTYLINLTFASEVRLGPACTDLEKIFTSVQAKYKIWWADKFVCFSPETFIQIDKKGHITTFPMKGTADASLPEARQMLEADRKEIAEHYTIVDLLRNDLALVADAVTVKRFRYFEKITSHQGALWQTSSEISGVLKPEFKKQYGSVMAAILPAGSVSGAPKKKTVEIITEIEPVPRGFYTGVAGFFDGEVLDAAVMIRFIEKSGDRFYYHSGGGIVFDSDVQKEYNELVKKIYLPV